MKKLKTGFENKNSVLYLQFFHHKFLLSIKKRHQPPAILIGIFCITCILELKKLIMKQFIKEKKIIRQF